MRFLTAYYANTPGSWILTGSERMKTGQLLFWWMHLKELGAKIEYLEKEGCPPHENRRWKLKRR